MKITVAKSAGFCFGVKRAVDSVYEAIAQANGKVYTYGPIIHNEVVMNDLKEKGVEVINSKEELEEIHDGQVIIRSHGVGKEIYDLLKRQKVEYLDVTCPFVLKIHNHVKEYSQKGYHIVIIGDKDHPEVQGICGWCDPNETTVINSHKEAEDFLVKRDKRICIVAQTTYNYNKFKELVEIFEKKGYDIIVLNTICNATEVRQAEAAKIAAEVDAMIVIGSKSSSNTRKLFEISKKECENTYYIQTLKDMDLSVLEFIDNVGITAGASTPNKIIEEVQNNVRIKF